MSRRGQVKKTVDPAELLHVVQVLRKLMTAYDAVHWVLDGSLNDISQQAEAYATTLRPQVRDTAEGIRDLLEQLETLPAYKSVRQAQLEQAHA